MDDQCVVRQRKVQRFENYVRCHLWGAFASFHWRCFRNYLRAEKRAAGGTNRMEGEQADEIELTPH